MGAGTLTIQQVSGHLKRHKLNMKQQAEVGNDSADGEGGAEVGATPGSTSPQQQQQVAVPFAVPLAALQPAHLQQHARLMTESGGGGSGGAQPDSAGGEGEDRSPKRPRMA